MTAATTGSSGTGPQLSALRDDLADVVPLWRRAVRLDARAATRVLAGPARLVVLVRPFGVLAGRTITRDTATGSRPVAPVDSTFRAADLLAWLDPDPTATGGRSTEPPSPRDADWRWSLPPTTGWRVVDHVPDTVIRDLVRTGALTLKQAAEREGVPGAQPRAEVSDALLDSVVLRVAAAPGHVESDITLRALSTLTRLAFLARGSTARVDTAGRWTRVAAAYGSVYLERAGMGLGLRTR